MITVSFACNDPDNGNFLGYTPQIQIDGTDGCFITLEAPSTQGPLLVLDDGDPLATKPRHKRGFCLYGRHFLCRGWNEWYGNWCWNATLMDELDVLGLLIHLRKHKWGCTQSSVNFSQAWDSAAGLTPSILHKALTPDDVLAAEKAKVA